MVYYGILLYMMVSGILLLEALGKRTSQHVKKKV